MTAPATPPRPRQVTLAATLIMGGSVLVVLMAFDRIAGLHTLETRESIEKFLAEPPGDDLGLGVEGVLDILRVFGMVAAGCATAAAILGLPRAAAQPERPARAHPARGAAVPERHGHRRLPVLGRGRGRGDAVVPALAGLVQRGGPGGTPDAVRRRADGSATRRPRRRRRPCRPPRAFPGFGAPPDPAAAPGQPQPWGAAPATDPASRPTAVVWASVLTWICTALAVLVMASSIAILVADPTFVFDELQRQNPSWATRASPTRRSRPRRTSSAAW